MGEENKVTVEYKTQKQYCHCCGQKLEELKISEVREFYFSKENFLEWLPQEDWIMEAECDDELLEMVEEFVCETISFFATSSDVTILIDNSEFEKVKKFVLEKVIAQTE